MSNLIVERKTEAITITALVAILLTVCLALPLVMQNTTITWYANYNQYIIGPAVNAALIYSVLRLKKLHNVVGIVLLPSICAALLGAIGINAVFLLYMIPFIWVGNMAIVLSFRFLFRNTKNAEVRYVMSAIIGIASKVAIIFAGFLIMRAFGVFPTPVAERLYTMMGVVQLITATIGAVIAYAVVKLIKERNRYQSV